jgi:hypothetical protein
MNWVGHCDHTVDNSSHGARSAIERSDCSIALSLSESGPGLATTRMGRCGLRRGAGDRESSAIEGTSWADGQVGRRVSERADRWASGQVGRRAVSRRVVGRTGGWAGR